MQIGHFNKHKIYKHAIHIIIFALVQQLLLFEWREANFEMPSGKQA